MKALFIFIAMIFFLLWGCSSEKVMEPKANVVSIAGAWSGVGKSSRGTPMTIEFSVSNVSNAVKGNGLVQLSGSIVKSYCTIDGNLNGGSISMNFWGDGWYFEFSGLVQGDTMNGNLSGLGATDGKITFVRK